MRIIIDGKETVLASEGVGFAQVFDRLVKHCAGEKRVVQEVTIDGEALSSLEEDTIRSVEGATIETLEAKTVPIVELSTEVLRKSADAIPRLIEGFYTSADTIQAGRTEEGYRSINQLLAFWTEILGGIGSGLTGSGLDPGTVSVEVGASGNAESLTGQEILRRINSLLEETQRAFEDRDSVEIADIVGYDLPVLLRGFQQSIYKLIS